MVALDIPCPKCGRADLVEKIGIGQYRCRACEFEFGREDVDVPG